MCISTIASQCTIYVCISVIVIQYQVYIYEHLLVSQYKGVKHLVGKGTFTLLRWSTVLLHHWMVTVFQRIFVDKDANHIIVKDLFEPLYDQSYNCTCIHTYRQRSNL